MNQIILQILKKKRDDVAEAQRNRTYGEWSCGQQDADSEADEHFDKLMSSAISLVEDNNVYCNMSDDMSTEIRHFINEIIDELKIDFNLWLITY